MPVSVVKKMEEPASIAQERWIESLGLNQVNTPRSRKHPLAGWNVNGGESSPDRNANPAILKWIGIVLKIHHVRPGKLKCPTPNEFLHSQFSLYLKQDSDLCLIVEWTVEATVVEINKHNSYD